MGNTETEVVSDDFKLLYKISEMSYKDIATIIRKKPLIASKKQRGVKVLITLNELSGYIFEGESALQLLKNNGMYSHRFMLTNKLAKKLANFKNDDGVSAIIYLTNKRFNPSATSIFNELEMEALKNVKNEQLLGD